MFKKVLAVTVLGAALAGFAPTGAFAADRDDYREHERVEHRDVREHVRADRERHRKEERYERGYYDRGGRWHSERW